MPETSAFLNAVLESQESWRKRKIIWAVHELAENEQRPTPKSRDVKGAHFNEIPCGTYAVYHGTTLKIMERALKAIDAKSVAFLYGETDDMDKAKQSVNRNFVTADLEVVADSFRERGPPCGQDGQ